MLFSPSSFVIIIIITIITSIVIKTWREKIPFPKGHFKTTDLPTSKKTRKSKKGLRSFLEEEKLRKNNKFTPCLSFIRAFFLEAERKITNKQKTSLSFIFSPRQ